MSYLTTPDGTDLFYRDYGAGRPIVFVHSMLMSSDMWQHSMLHLAEHGYRTVAYDRRGHGRSDDPGTGYEFDTLADDLAALLDQLELTDVMLVGHSMGGGEVIRYLTRHGSQRVSRIALVGATAPYLDVDASAAAAQVERIRTEYGDWVADNAGLSFGDHLPGCTISQLEREATVRDWMRVSLHAAVECTRANVAADFRTEARRITLPALVIHGDHDVFAPLHTCGQRSADLIADSKLLIYENGSHMLHLSHRPRLGRDLLDFAAS
ncbi:alpha/beta hydrolase [Nocardia sp. NEAU-G5]|uniref:Alpha/beta hydrolase n=1 Tax=Nocardia albiluteola TaxID=2842303 RepID=A0ABS6AXF7_9NOCA|nr:alpha/beta hydrolase [Nocardia albiluteola]MBU3062737.1 alpha/beta hydrolase [Nocardia albiluteola]